MKVKKILYICGEPHSHPSEPASRILADMCAEDGRFELEIVRGPEHFVKLNSGEYAAVLVYTTGYDDELYGEREEALFRFVENGGGLIGLHSATDSFKHNRRWLELIGSKFYHHEDFKRYEVRVEDGYYITRRLQSFTLPDELYHLEMMGPPVQVVAYTPWRGGKEPMMYVKEHGKGRVAYLALGHDLRSFSSANFQKLLMRGIAWAAKSDVEQDKVLRCGIVGYGAAFQMGKNHCNWINSVEGMKAVAMCDIDPSRLIAAREEQPNLEGYFTSVSEMLANCDLDIVTAAVPHNQHFPVVMECLEAGKNVISEKPFCINVAEANAMIAKAKEKGVMLTVFQNRRWDSDYLEIKDIVTQGLIGQILNITYNDLSFSSPNDWWRSDKAISGGRGYDWGAHTFDWMLNLIGGKITQVMANSQKRFWNQVTNEDHLEIYVTFTNGATITFTSSSLAAVKRPQMEILGTRGSITKTRDGKLLVNTLYTDRMLEAEREIPKAGDWRDFYCNIADHLLMGEALAVKPEQSRRVVGILEAADQSAALGRSVAPVEGCE